MNTTITQLQSNSDGLFSTAFLMFPSSVSSDDQEIWQRWSVERNHSVLAHVCFFVCFCLKQKKKQFFNPTELIYAALGHHGLRTWLLRRVTSWFANGSRSSWVEITDYMLFTTDLVFAVAKFSGELRTARKVLLSSFIPQNENSGSLWHNGAVCRSAAQNQTAVSARDSARPNRKTEIS